MLSASTDCERVTWMPIMQIEVSDKVAAELAELAERCSQADEDRNGATTHGPLDARVLLTMLAEDAAMVISRPGSWEGAGMAQHLAAHGYEV